MAIGDHLPRISISSATSTSSSSSSSLFNKQYRTQVVATHNSSTFIQFLTNSRQSTVFLPETNHSIARPPSRTTDVQSLSNITSLTTEQPLRKIRSCESQKCNPILSNSLLNHRREQPKSIPVKKNVTSSRTIRLCLSANASNSRKRIFPLRRPNSDIHKSDQETLPVVPNEPHLDKNKYDYITRWLRDVAEATSNIIES